MSVLIGISGGSGSGKTHLINQLLQRFKPAELCALSIDHYYRPRELLTKDTNGKINFDLPSCIDHIRLLNDIHELLKGRNIQLTEYTFNNPNKNARILNFHTAPYIILEGIFSFHFPEITQLIDLKIFIDCDDELRLQRRLERDAKERAYLEEDIQYQWKNHVRPAHLQYLIPQQEIADLVIDGTSTTSTDEVYNAIMQIKKHKQ